MLAGLLILAPLCQRLTPGNVGTGHFQSRVAFIERVQAFGKVLVHLSPC